MILIQKKFLGGNLFGYSCDQKGTNQILDKALESNIFGIDTADVYSNGTSEKYIGKWFKGSQNRDAFFVATKVGTKKIEEANGLGRFHVMEKRLVQSLKRLDFEYVDLLQLHHIDKITRIEETIEASLKLKEKGLIKTFGICNVTIDYLESIIKKDLIHYLDYIQIYGNWIFNEELEKIVKKVKSYNINVLVYGALGRGVLSGRYLMDTPSDSIKLSRKVLSFNVYQDILDQNLKNLLTDLYTLITPYGISLTDVALCYINNLNVNSVVGCRTINQVQEYSKCQGLLTNEIIEMISILREKYVFRFSSETTLGKPDLSSESNRFL
jgi:aryl-alcohol dehydrogenase-like predicted oxidoreductase